MNMQDASTIDLGKLGNQMKRYERQWVAIASNNTIVGYGPTYREALDVAKREGSRDVMLFKVPPLDYSFAPAM